MTAMLPQDVHEGMQVFAGSDEIGKVSAVFDDRFEVTRGLLNRHVYVIPKKFVAEAGEDVIDLTIDKQQVDGLEVTNVDELSDLPDEYKRIEGLEDPKANEVDEDDLFRR